MTTVTVSAVNGPGLLSRTARSRYQGLFWTIAGVTVAGPPVPPPPLTVKLSDVVRDSVPETPVIVTVAAPSVAVLEAVSVSVLALPVVGSGPSVALTPAGRPLALRSTEPVKLVRMMLTVLDAEAPRFTASEDGLADRVKFGPTMLTASVVVRVPRLLAPLIVMLNVPGAAVPTPQASTCCSCRSSGRG